jgi:hypothetical protein
MPYYIAFDLSHKPRAKIDENFTELRDHLNMNDFICYNYLETPITQDTLRLYDIIVFACPDFAKISPQEILEIVNWVKEEGGGLLLLSHAGGDRGRSSNLTELSEHFGIAFENDQVLDDMNNVGMENLPVITAAHFIPPHPVTEGINEICYRAGCSLTVVGGAMSVVYSNETSEPFSCPLICVSEQDKGRVCAIGSYEMFRDRTGGGFQQDEHANLALNIFKWLITDHRMEVTEHGTVHHAVATQTASEVNNATSPYSTDLSAQRGATIGRIDASIKFNNKDELLSLLTTYLNQIDVIKQNIENLVKGIDKYGETLFEQPSLQPGVVQQEQSTEQSSSEYYHPAMPAVESELKVSSDQGEFAFSALPTKPQTFVEKVEEEKSMKEFIGLEPVEVKERDTVEKKTDVPMSKIKEPPKRKAKGRPKKKPKNEKEELEAELEGLESKLNSVFNLLSFIEKKHESGKIDDKSYEKQTQKLERDLSGTKKRIEEIRNSLEE